MTSDKDGWRFKVRYRYDGEIPARLREDASTSWYRCSTCHHLHIGHSRVEINKGTRKIGSRADLADLLIKLRGQATRTQVAKVAKVRPIRLKEWEECSPSADFDALLAVLAVYRVDLAAVLRGPAR